ncbi:MAG: hypothetical protein GPJ51_02480 [Candidatus Heimdallarchaeota archaeon]|nr:hypothetical protein [Candidatus Heimdallarchaeota archaeon]
MSLNGTDLFKDAFGILASVFWLAASVFLVIDMIQAFRVASILGIYYVGAIAGLLGFLTIIGLIVTFFNPLPLKTVSILPILLTVFALVALIIWPAGSYGFLWSWTSIVATVCGILVIVFFTLYKNKQKVVA